MTTADQVPPASVAARPSEAGGLLRSIGLVGGAQALNVIIGIVRVKLLVLLVGPAGYAILSVFTGVVQTASGIGGLGLRVGGVREIAAADDPAAKAHVQRVLTWAHALQAVPVVVLIWALRERLSEWLFGSPDQAVAVGLLGIAVALTLVATAQQTALQGMRRIGDLARVTVYGALAGTVVGLGMVLWLGPDGLLALVIMQPLVHCLVARLYVARLRRPALPRLHWRSAVATWRPLARAGVAFMLSGLLSTATVLLVRSFVLRTEGLEAAGHFAASWALTMQYIGFVLGAMAADYYPRLSSVASDPARANALMNTQLQLGLAIAGPIILAMIGLAPLMVIVLYSSDFLPAVPILQWQLAGNVLKLAAWPLGFLLLAKDRSGQFLAVELLFNATFAGATVALAPSLGPLAPGPAFVVAYAAYLLALHRLVARAPFSWAGLSIRLLGAYGIGASLLLISAAAWGEVTTAALGLSLALAGAVFGLRAVLAATGREGKLAARLHDGFARFGWPVAAP